MKLAILSDVHGNCIALDTVLAGIARQGVDQIVGNGDMIQSGRNLLRPSSVCVRRNVPLSGATPTRGCSPGLPLYRDKLAVV